uniref:non-specific serine/threonine protein kinase n=1 Tax=Phallusia mammillata TaxID=59560 RepID=A0A6F9DCH5_9ASCI|nr:eukaryotic translation initiation factor 2-alpha kinase 4 [Phallusia mammillata]
MTEEESYSDRQADELESLESIFGSDVKDLRKNDAWKVKRPPEFLLHLQPQESMGGDKAVHVYIDMKVKFPPTYPDCCPDIKFESPHGLSSDVVNKLEQEVTKLSKSMVGEVMMFQLAQYIQEYLHKHNVPQFASIHEEMVQNQQKQMEKVAKEEKKKRELLRRQEEIQRKQIEEELARRQEEERKIRKQERKEKDHNRNISEGSGGSMDTDHKFVGVIEVKFPGKQPRSVHLGQCLGKKRSGDAMTIVGMETNTGELVVNKQWKIPCPVGKSLLTNAERAKIDKCLKAINTIEQELQSLMKLSHDHIVSYIGMKSTQCENFIEVDILQEYIRGISLQQKMLSKERIALETVRIYTEQMLQALSYLHRKSVVHKNFHAKSVFLDSNGHIKIANYSIGKRLQDLYMESHIEQPGVRFSEDRIPARITKKGDILRMGMVVISLALGHSVADYPPEIPSTLPQVFIDFLERCLVVEDRLRFSASELLEHEFIKPPVGSNLELQSENYAIISNLEDVKQWEAKNEEDELEFEHSSPENISRPVQLSRLHSEFEELDWLGKGGYGDVVKVRNKLDGRNYAIKRIHLNPHRSQFNKKITREVKLLSRLNHENVVRYYNSWIETIQCNADEISTSSSNIETLSEAKKVENSRNSLGIADDIEKLAPPPVQSSSGWSISTEDISRVEDVDDEDDDEDDLFKTNWKEPNDLSSDSILFDHDGDSESSSDDNSVKMQSSTIESTTMETSASSNELISRRFLYIQMEYCEKSTLRQTIDAGVCHDQDRMWRLFREILEGLVHVHEQGMIHRDLKPQNIFLDKNDHIKIGDFGLATSHSRGLSNGTPEESGSRSEPESSMLTGDIGTTLYVAPELLTSGRRTVYSQKVDIYSLGIIFMEMVHVGLLTKMERVKVLTSLRKPAIIFPEDFDEVKYERECKITKWCLNHDPAQRPTASELLKCRLVPTPVLEENEVLEAVHEMLSDPRSKPYRLVIDAVFSQAESPVTSVIYDIDTLTQKQQHSVAGSVAQQQVHDKIAAILKHHGAVTVNLPLLNTRQNTEIQNSEAATLLDVAGAIVSLPYNLRVPFARYISCTDIFSVKRYAIDKVFRARRVRGSRPKELWECAFDIVTPTVGGLVPDAEVISAVAEIISHFPTLAARKYEVRINHLLALQAIFTYCGLDEEHHHQALNALASCDRASKSQVETCLSSLPINHQQVATLCSFALTQGDLAKIQLTLKSIIRNKHSQSSAIARQAIHELEAIRKHLSAIHMELPLVFDLGFIHKYHFHYNGIVFQVSAEIQKKKRTAIDILAVGGRYDVLVESMSYLRLDNLNGSMDESKNPQKHVTGVSIAIEKIVASVVTTGKEALAQNNTESDQDRKLRHSSIDVLVCAIGRSQLLSQRLGILKSLWDAGISAETPYDRNPQSSVQDMQEFAQQRGVSHLVYITEKESGMATVKSLNGETNGKSSDRKVPVQQLLDYLNKKIGHVDDTTSINSVVKPSSTVYPTASDAQASQNSASHHGGTRQLNLEVVAPEKLAFNVRRRIDYEIRTKLSSLPLLSHISNKTRVCAFAVELPSNVLKSMATSLDVRNTEEEFNTSVAKFTQDNPRYKKYISNIAERISEVSFAQQIPFVILYSYKDDGYYLLV